MKKFLYLLRLQMFFMLCQFTFFALPAQTIISGGSVAGSWAKANSPYFIEGSCTVHQNSILSIEPGVELYFSDSVVLYVHGVLLANGNISDSIRFMARDTSNFADTSIVKGGWGGVRLYAGIIDSKAIFNYCVFTHAKTISTNDTLGKGAVIYAKNFRDVHISHSRFTNNLSKNMGGAVYYSILTNILIDSCLFNHNTVYGAGGAIANEGHCNSFITNCIIVNNRVRSNSNISNAGGGVYTSVIDLASAYTPILVNNYICNNVANNGGGIYESTAGCQIVGNIICNNQSDGIFCGHSLSVSHYTNNTICNNGFDKKHPQFTSAGILTASNFINVKNNIIWGNWASNVDTMQIEYVLWGPPTLKGVKYNTIQYWIQGSGNIADTPMFVKPTIGSGILYNGLLADWSLKDSSKSINSGYFDTTGLYLKPYDILGNPRWYGTYIDRGAVENQIILAIGESAHSDIDMHLFPNPVNDLAYIKVNNRRKGDYYEVYDISGKRVKTGPIISNINQIYVGDLPSGVYQVLYRSTDSQMVQKLIKL